MHFDFVSLDLVAQRLFQLSLQLVDVHPFTACLAYSRYGCQLRQHRDRRSGGGRSRFKARGTSMATTGEGTQLLKSAMNGFGNLSHFLVVHPGSGVKNHEESEKQSHKIGVGNQPPLVTDRGSLTGSAAHAGCGSGCVCSSLYPSSLVSSLRGFMPSRIEITPSRVISRKTCSSRPLIFSLPENGKKSRLADPTP